MHCDACLWCGDPDPDPAAPLAVPPIMPSRPLALIVKPPEEFEDALREAVAVLRATGRSVWDLFGDDGMSDDEPAPAIAHALGFVEGAAAALGVTAIELLDEYDLLSAADDD